MAATVTATVTGAEVPRLSPLHWGAAWLVALALHLGVLWAYTMAPDDGADDIFFMCRGDEGALLNVGELFKVMGLAGPDWPDGAGFSDE